MGKKLRVEIRETCINHMYSTDHCFVCLFVCLAIPPFIGWHGQSIARAHHGRIDRIKRSLAHDLFEIGMMKNIFTLQVYLSPSIPSCQNCSGQLPVQHFFFCSFRLFVPPLSLVCFVRESFFISTLTLKGYPGHPSTMPGHRNLLPSISLVGGVVWSKNTLRNMA